MGTLNKIGAPNVVNALFYGNGATYTAITPVNNAVLITDASGVPLESTTLPAAVQANITQVGTISSGVWDGTQIAIGYGGTNASSYTQTNGIIAYNGTSLVNYSGPQIDSSGRRTNVSQPTFLATIGAAANVTGDNTTYTVTWPTVIVNDGSDFDGTSTFTAPINGIMNVGFSMTYSNLTSSSFNRCPTTVQNGGSGSFGGAQIFTCDPNVIKTPSNVITFCGFGLGIVDAGDAVTTTASVGVASKTVGVNTPAFFSGNMIF